MEPLPPYGCIDGQSDNLRLTTTVQLHQSTAMSVCSCMSVFSYSVFMYLRRASWHFSATVTEVSPCLFLSLIVTPKLDKGVNIFSIYIFKMHQHCNMSS